MTPEEFHEILIEVLKQQSVIPWWSYLLFFLLPLIGVLIGSYLKKRIENYATKADIEGITDKVESVRSGYAEILEEIKSDNQLKIASIEREKQLKKEVYMEAAEALTKALNMIANFPNLNESEESLTAEFSLEVGKIAKVQIVGTGKTVQAVTTLMNSIGEATLALMLARQPLVQRAAAIDIRKRFRDKSQSEVDRYLSIMKSLNLQGNSDQGLWDTINRSIEFENGSINKYNDEIDSLIGVQNKEQAEYSSKCMNTFFEISTLLPNVVLAVREELDLKIDPNEYVEIYTNSLKKGELVFNEFLMNLEPES